MFLIILLYVLEYCLFKILRCSFFLRGLNLIALILFTFCLTLLHGKFKIDFCIHFAAVYFQSLSEIVTGFVKIRIAPGKNAGIIKSRVTYRIRGVFCN